MADINYTPDVGTYISLKPFRFWCQKIMPLVYDDSLSYYELLCKIVDYLNKTMEDVDTLNTDVNNLLDAYNKLQLYVNNYFANLDVQKEINNKLDEMAQDGTLTAVINVINERRYSEIVEPALGDELITSYTGGTNWSGSITDGLTYNGTGDTGDTISFPINAVTGKIYLVSFTTERIDPEDSFTLEIGGYTFTTYNGSNTFNFGIVAKSDTLTIHPTSAFSGNIIKNLSVKEVIGSRTPCFTIYDKNTGEIIDTLIYYDGNYFLGNGGTVSLKANNNMILGKNSGVGLTTGYWNTAVGINCLGRNTVGTRNVAVGINSLAYSEVGDRNIAIGSFAGQNLTNPTSNVLIGSDTMYVKENGNNNVAIGRSSMAVAEGDYNTCVGAWSGASIDSDNNTLIGYSAGSSISTRGNNTMIGYRAGRYLSAEHCVGIGSEVVFPLQSRPNQINIGNYFYASPNDKVTQIGLTSELVKREQLVPSNQVVENININGPASFATYGADGRYIGAIELKTYGNDSVGTVFGAIAGKIGNNYLTELYSTDGQAPAKVLEFFNKNIVLSIQEQPTSNVQNGTIYFDGDNLHISTNSGWKTITLTDE